jgi:hypothetical protein
MCRYAWHNYRDHFACFECRKAFKYWQWGVTSEKEFNHKQQLKYVPREITCPDCKKPMVDMGLDFKAPPKNDADAWEIMRALSEHGFDFHSCGCGVGYVPPRTLREVPAWIEKHRQHTESEKLLGKFSDRAQSE